MTAFARAAPSDFGSEFDGEQSAVICFQSEIKFCSWGEGATHQESETVAADVFGEGTATGQSRGDGSKLARAAASPAAFNPSLLAHGELLRGGVHPSAVTALCFGYGHQDEAWTLAIVCDQGDSLFAAPDTSGENLPSESGSRALQKLDAWLATESAKPTVQKLYSFCAHGWSS